MSESSFVLSPESSTKSKQMPADDAERMDDNRAKLHAKLKKKWPVYCLMGIAFIILQVILWYASGETFWDPPSSYSILWLSILSIALMFVYRIAAAKRFWQLKFFVVTWGSILVHIFAIALVLYLGKSHVMCPDIAAMAIPYVFAPMLVTALVGATLGTYVTIAVSILGCILLAPNFDQITELEMFKKAFTSSVHYITISMCVGMLVVHCSRKVTERNKLLGAGALAGLTVFLLASILTAIRFNITSAEISTLIWEIVAAIGVSFILSVIINGILPMLEKWFSTPISWIELSDPSNKLRQEMKQKAPGSYHHSQNVATLAQNAAEAIGADAGYCQVASLYHDIGKLSNPEYFVENLTEGQISPHTELTPIMSARVIIRHVEDGVRLAEANKLGREIIDAIQQHHGVGVPGFFYKKALEYREEILKKVAEGKAEADAVPEVNEKDFHYPGPRPQNREIGIISLADIVESAVRSLVNPTTESIKNMINRLINERIVEGHLDESGLTLGDIKTIREVFLKTIKDMGHIRIAYDTEPPKPVALESASHSTASSAQVASMPLSQPSDPVSASAPSTSLATASEGGGITTERHAEPSQFPSSNIVKPLTLEQTAEAINAQSPVAAAPQILTKVNPTQSATSVHPIPGLNRKTTPPADRYKEYAEKHEADTKAPSVDKS